MIKIIVGENNSGKSRYLRKEYTKSILEDEFTRVIYSIENPIEYIQNICETKECRKPKYLQDGNGCHEVDEAGEQVENTHVDCINCNCVDEYYILDELYKEYLDMDEINSNVLDKIYINSKPIRTFEFEKEEPKTLSSQGLRRSMNFKIIKELNFSKVSIVFKVLYYLQVYEEQIFKYLSDLILKSVKHDQYTVNSILIPTIRNIEYTEDTTNNNSNRIKYAKEYKLYANNIRTFESRVAEIKKFFLVADQIVSKINNELESFDIMIEQNSSGSYFDIKYIGVDKQIGYTANGDGYIQILNIVIEIVKLKEFEDIKTIYIDEFNLSMHPKLSKMLIQYFSEIADFEFVLTTHSVDFIDNKNRDNDAIKVLTIKDKETLELVESDYFELIQLLDIEFIKTSRKNVVIVESEIDAAIYKQLAKLLQLNNIEFRGLRGVCEIPKLLKSLNQDNVYGIVDYDDDKYECEDIYDLIEKGRIFRYEGMYTLENIVYNPYNLKQLLDLDIVNLLQEDLKNENVAICFNDLDIEIDKYFLSKDYADYLKDSYKKIIIQHCYNNEKKQFIKLKDTYLAENRKKFITNINNFPIAFIEMLRKIDALGV